MNSLIFFVILIAALFVLNYITKRRFGVLGLALAAGSLISTNWAGTLTPFIEQQGIIIVAPPLATIVQSLLILLPPLLLLFGGPTYSKTWSRVLGAAAFSVLAFAFLLGPLGAAVQVSGNGQSLYEFFHNYQSLIIVIGLGLAVVDVFLTRKGKSGHKAAH